MIVVVSREGIVTQRGEKIDGATLQRGDFWIQIPDDSPVGIGWIEEKSGNFRPPEIPYEEALIVCEENPGLNLSDLLKGRILPDVDFLRKMNCDKIDQRTQEIIAQGFQFDGKTFSLSANAQLTFLGLYTIFLGGILSDGTPISTKDNRSYVLHTAAMPGFFQAFNIGVTVPLSSGRDLKDQIMTETNQEKLLKFVDPR